MKRRLTQLIHIGKAELGWDDAMYRSALSRLTGKTSTTRCTLDELESVLAYLKAQGFQPKAAKQHGRRPRVALQRKQVLSKIEALLTEANRPWGYAEKMAQHMFKIHFIDWLSDTQLTKLMQALIVDAARRNREETATVDDATTRT